MVKIRYKVQHDSSTVVLSAINYYCAISSAINVTVEPE